MSIFGRTITDNALDTLTHMTSKDTGWWSDLLSNWAPSGSQGYLRLAIRNGYMNFYARGQSVAKVSFGVGGKNPSLRVHHKYTIDSPSIGQKYITFDARGNSSRNEELVYEGSHTLKSWIQRSRNYSNREKCYIDALVETLSSVIDLEMGLPAYGDRKNSLRVDIVSLEGSKEDIQIVFSEAKMISDSRLRSKDHCPKVIDQINRYRAYLDDHERKARIVNAYRRTCKVIQDIHMLANEITKMPPLDPLLLAASEPDSRLRVNDKLRLIVFDDGKRRREEAWQEHLDVLRREVCVRVLKRGTKGFEIS